MPSVIGAHHNNLKATKRNDFDLKMTTELLTKKATICRIHVAGDYNSAEYAKKWIAIVKANPTVKFFTYTRSWRIPEIRPRIEELASLPNMRMWWSLDCETGHPDDVPERVGLAYMAVAPHELPEHPVDLFFRDYDIRNSVMKKFDGALVCPPENGVNKDMHCQQCGFCWRNELRVNPLRKLPRIERTRQRRIALQMVA